ncbi:MAG: zf-HC2 domain-containing protein [Thermodesulfobacteriota bacterium]
MRCGDCQKIIGRLVDGELDADVVTTVQEHLSSCAECRAFHERLTSLDRSLKSMPRLEPRMALARMVKARIVEERRGSQTSIFVPRWIQVPVAVALIMVAVGLGNLAGRSLTEILEGPPPDAGLELLVSSPGMSFGEVLTEIHGQESVR